MNHSGDGDDDDDDILDSVSSAVIMTVIARILSVHQINVEQCHVPADFHTKSTKLGHESTCMLLSSAPNIVIWYYHHHHHPFIRH